VSEPATDRSAGTVPRLSVVIASSNDDRVLSQCIAALAPQAAPGDVELFVVRASDRPSSLDRQRLKAEVPSLQWIDAPSTSTVPRLRGLGIAASHAAMLEDDCVVNDDWCRQAISAVGAAVAVGGVVEPGAYHRPLDWAVYFAEYARFMRPSPATHNAPLSGNNVVYSRRALQALPAEWQADFREAFIHSVWQRDGRPTAVSNALVVRNVNSWSTTHLTSVPFHHGRAFAGQRFEGRSPILRAGFALLALGLPLLKVARVTAETVRRGRLVGPLLRALPWIAVFAVSWSAGELVGCLRGAGDSPSRWR
jgi:hypothetical protein